VVLFLESSQCEGNNRGRKTLRISGFALISVSDYNIDKCEEDPGTYQTVSGEAVFSKTRFRQ
jgi:hypothetical protein